MNVIKKARTFSMLNRHTKRLMLEAYFYLGWARMLKVRPFAKVAPSLGQQREETSLEHNLSEKNMIKRVSEVIHMMSRYTFWESECLVKAIAGMKMLEKRQIESTLYLGTAKDENGELIAHAWLRSGPFYISGSQGMERFTVVATFANKISRKILEGETYGQHSQSRTSS